MGDRSAAQYVEVNDTEVKIVNKGLLDYTRRLVAVIGPTGAGKSTMCNVLYHIAFGTKSSFFEPSSQPQSFTKGLWLLSPEARAQLSDDLKWEVVDMEGFQADQMSSWKMAMVLSVLAEIVIFCNRDARCDNIFKAATVFEKGRKLSKQLGMKPVTSMVFVQVEEGIEPELLEEVLTRVRSMIPDMKVIPFEIPQLRNKNKKDHAFITFHQELVEAVNTNLVQKFAFDEQIDAASSKSRSVAELLDAFNQGNYLKCKDLNAELLKADLERIYEAAVAVFRNVHVTKALNTQLTSTETTLEQFMGSVDAFAPDYKKSSFYVVGKSDKFVEDFAALQPAVDCKQIYQNFYKDKMEELVERLQREKLIREQKEKDFHQDVQRCIEAARNGLLRHVSTLTFGQSLTKPQDEFLEAKKSLDERAKAFNTKPEFGPFYKFYADQGACVKGMWEAQINKAKWKAPVSCQGKLKCKAGHKINEDMICCINQLKAPNKDGSTVCGGRWYWIDGPTRHAMCRGTCGSVQKMPTNLTCFKCGEETLCEIRPSVYYP